MCGGGGYLSLGALGGGPSVPVRGAPLTRWSAGAHELVGPHRVDEVAQVFVVKVTGQEAGHVDLEGEGRSVRRSYEVDRVTSKKGTGGTCPDIYLFTDIVGYFCIVQRLSLIFCVTVECSSWS